MGFCCLEWPFLSFSRRPQRRRRHSHGHYFEPPPFIQEPIPPPRPPITHSVPPHPQYGIHTPDPTLILPENSHLVRIPRPRSAQPPAQLRPVSKPPEHIQRVPIFHPYPANMAFAGYRSSPAGLQETIMRSVEQQALLTDLLANYAAADLLSRDENIRLGGVRNFSGLSDQERRLQELVLDDLIRRVNLIVQLTNNMVTPQMRYAEVHPKVMDNGQYPREFERPRRLEELLSVDNTSLDRILQSYGLPRDIRNGLGSNVRDRYSTSLLSEGPRDSKFRVLFEYLGVVVDENYRPGIALSPTFDRARLSGGLGGGAFSRGRLEL